jgi:hypothetical protein
VVACRPPPEATHILPVRAIRPKTPGAKILKAAITTSRYGSSPVAAAIAHARPTSGFIVEIDSQQLPAHRRPRQRGIPALARENFGPTGCVSMTKPAMLGCWRGWVPDRIVIDERHLRISKTMLDKIR